jgi:hypothetical protein
MGDDYRNGLWRRPNPQFHMTTGAWDSPVTARYCTQAAYALYPANPRWGIKAEDGGKLPILRRAGGFYWPIVHNVDLADLALMRRARVPLPMTEEVSSRDYLYFPFLPGQKLRQSVWLDSLEGLQALELVILFGASRASDFSADLGDSLALEINGQARSLAELGVWPPSDEGVPVAAEKPTERETLSCTIRIPPELLRANAVNWLVLHQDAPSVYYMPCVPAALEPYIAPLWGETADAHLPAIPR